MTRKTTMVLTAAAAALALTACGDTAEGDGAAAKAPDDQTELAFARCMREHGVEIPDPSPGGGPRRLELKAGKGGSPQKFQEAAETCRGKTGGGPRELSAEQRQQMQDEALKFARCMREHGVDMPDPKAGGGVVLVGPGKGAGQQNPARLERAEAACRELLPKPPGGGQAAGATFEVSP